MVSTTLITPFLHSFSVIFYPFYPFYPFLSSFFFVSTIRPHKRLFFQSLSLYHRMLFTIIWCHLYIHSHLVPSLRLSSQSAGGISATFFTVTWCHLFILSSLFTETDPRHASFLQQVVYHALRCSVKSRDTSGRDPRLHNVGVKKSLWRH